MFFNIFINDTAKISFIKSLNYERSMKNVKLSSG